MTSYARTLQPDQRCRVHVYDTVTGADSIVFESTELLLEAPNWSIDGMLVLNGAGTLWRLASDGTGDLEPIPLEVPELNNDHVISPDGTTLYLSANDGHIYAAPIAGGTSVRVTADADGRMHFLHGVSPDGTTLAYVAISPPNWSDAHLRLVGVDGSDDRALTEGAGPDDGPEFSPDGTWIHLNTERFSTEPGHAQLARIRPDGTGLEQLTHDERVNWFPHFSPDGSRVIYLSFPPGTVGHPADLVVQLRGVEGGRWDEPTVLVELEGGQGTINVNGWAPDSRRFAYVDYPLG